MNEAWERPHHDQSQLCSLEFARVNRACAAGYFTEHAGRLELSGPLGVDPLRFLRVGLLEHPLDHEAAHALLDQVELFRWKAPSDRERGGDLIERRVRHDSAGVQVGVVQVSVK